MEALATAGAIRMGSKLMGWSHPPTINHFQGADKTDDAAPHMNATLQIETCRGKSG